MRIRSPEPDDVEPLVELGAVMHAESAYAFLPYQRHKVRALVYDYIQDQETLCGLVAEDGGQLVGMIGGQLVEYFFCDDWLACDTVLFVHPSFRGGLTAMRLIRGLRRWAVERGAQELCLGISTGVHTDTTGRLYERLGFVRVGGLYKQRLS